MIIGQEHKVTFKVNVMGTSTEPSVKVTLGTTPELSFPATQVGDSWTTVIKVPEGVEPGSYLLKIDVVVGNRHFSPLSKMVDVTSIERMETPAEIKPKVVAAEEVAPIEQPVAEEEQVVVAPAAEPEFDIFLKQEAQAPLPTPTAPRAKKMVKLPKDLFKAENLKVPSVPVQIERKPIIMRDVAHTAMDRPVKITEAVKKPKKIVELKHELPTRLIKGDIVYE